MGSDGRAGLDRDGRGRSVFVLGVFWECVLLRVPKGSPCKSGLGFGFYGIGVSAKGMFV